MTEQPPAARPLRGEDGEITNDANGGDHDSAKGAATIRIQQKTAVMKYFIRSLKYFVALCVLCAAIMALNRLSASRR